ncbi:MAG: SlyX family protein [Phycisphaerales bacterium]|nr:SlyX family protein [Phycisphaerales bacterium]
MNQPVPPPSGAPLDARIERLEELAMFADHRHDTLAAMVEELSRQVAEMHATIETLNKRLRDAERTITPPDAPAPEDEVPPHNAF